MKRTHVTSGLTKGFVELKLDNGAVEKPDNNNRSELTFLIIMSL